MPTGSLPEIAGAEQQAYDEIKKGLSAAEVAIIEREDRLPRAFVRNQRMRRARIAWLRIWWRIDVTADAWAQDFASFVTAKK